MREEQLMSAEDEIRALLKTYEDLLNASAFRAAACYTSDGVFIPAGLPTVVGGAMADAYARLLKVLRLQITFAINELVIASEEIAYALTESHGTQTVLATGTDSVESNREMFIFRREKGVLENRALHVQYAPVILL
jgi:ketosteroid isomerase-like protein